MKVFLSGRDYNLRFALEETSHEIFYAPRYDWEFWAYGNETPLNFSKFLKNEFKTLNLDCLVLVRGCDASVPNPKAQPSFWMTEINTIHQLRDSGKPVITLETTEDPNKSLVKSGIPKESSLFIKDINPNYTELANTLESKIQNLSTRYYNKTLPCCRGKWL